MKKTSLVIGLIMIATTVATYAQKEISEGKIETEITLSDDFNEQMAAYMPKNATTYFKDDQSRTEMTTMGMTMVTLYNDKTKEMINLNDMMGKKSAVKTDLNKAKEEAADVKVENTTDSKTICGYKCTLAKVTDAEGHTTEVWYTKEISAKTQAQTMLKGIDGFPLQYTVAIPNMEGTMTMTVKKVSEEKVDTKLFEVPSDYTVMTAEEAKKQYGGGK